MKYKSENAYIFDITDDTENFQLFLNYAISHAPIEIYVCPKLNTYSGSGIVSNPSKQTYQQQETPHQTQQETYTQETYPQETYRTQETFNTREIYPQETYHHEPPYNEREVEPIPGTDDWTLYHYDEDEETVFKEKKFDCPFDPPIVDMNDSDDDEEDLDDEEDDGGERSQHVEEYIFWNMPPLLGELAPKKKPPRVSTTYKRSELIKAGQTFANKDEFLRELHTKCLEENFQVKPKKSDKSRYTAKCMLPDCEWKCSAYKLHVSDHFVVRKLNDVHTCSRTQIMGNNKHANKKVLGHMLMNSMKSESRDYKGKDIQSDISDRYRVSISYNQAYRAKCYAIEMLRGSMPDSFRKMPMYFHNLKLQNPGSSTNIVTDNEDKFVMAYMSIGAVIRTFVQNVRPVIIVDGAHLKDGYLGTNLVAVAMDGNNAILPLAYGIGEGETNNHWTWFLGNLRDHLESCGMGERVSELVFISDRAPAIAHGISTVFPEAFHSICARHLYMNLKNQSNQLRHFTWHYWRMVKAYRYSDFQDHLDVFRAGLFASYMVLTNLGYNKWSRNQSDKVRYAYMTSNSVESMNSLSVHARKLPVTMLLEFFRASIQDWFFKHRNTGENLTSLVTPYAEHKIGKRDNKSRTWTVHPSTNTLLEVRDGRKNGTVNLEDRTCTCMQWQLSGIPCGHVIAVARYFKIDDVSCYVERWFTTATYRATYVEHIAPLPHPSEWTNPGTLQIVHPPTLQRRQPGRPKGRARIPSQGEEVNETKSVKRCSRCHQPGHNRSTCRASYDLTSQSTSNPRTKKEAKSRSKSKARADPESESQEYPSVRLG